MISSIRWSPWSLLVAISLVVALTTASSASAVPGGLPAPQAEHGSWKGAPADALVLALEATADAGGIADPRLISVFERQHRTLETAQHLLDPHDGNQENDLKPAVELAQALTRQQAEDMGLEWSEPVPLTGYEKPSAALLELADRHDMAPDEDGLHQLQKLDQQPEAVRQALARFVDAFLAFESATVGAFTHADLDHLRSMEMEDDPIRGPPLEIQHRFEEAGLELAPVLSTRNQLLDSISELARVHDTSLSTSDCDVVALYPVFSVSLGECDEHYTQDVILLLDTGGSDRFHNNAGGSGLQAASCVLTSRGASALVALGDGADEYGNPRNPRECGANGGGYRGAGVLVDSGGSDTYTTGQQGSNGGAFTGVGFLLDLAGADSYTARGGGTNGGGNSGVGLLLDLSGDDTFTAGGEGTNGGGFTGAGSLWDGGGDDRYFAGSSGTNGGGSIAGVGSLVDLSGNDGYVADGGGTNGGADFAASGSLVDLDGDDRYTAGSFGTNGGGTTAGVGSLLDLQGEDTYAALSEGTNGGGYFAATGSLLDLGGDDTYTAASSGTNGGARTGAVGFLLDLEGDDTYGAGALGVNGGGGGASGTLLDAGGTDRYSDQESGTCWDCTIVPKGNVGAQLDKTDVDYTLDVGCTPPSPGDTLSCALKLEVEGNTLLDMEENLPVPDPVRDTTGLRPVWMDEHGVWIAPSPDGADTGPESVPVTNNTTAHYGGASFSCDEGVRSGDLLIEGEGYVPFSVSVDGVSEPSLIDEHRCRVLSQLGLLEPMNIPFP